MDKNINIINISSSQEDAFSNNVNNENRNLIVLCPPSVKNSYYKKYFNELVDFYISYTNIIINRDNIIIIIDKLTISYYKDKIPNDIILLEVVDDIWIRDFSTVFPKNPLLFNYKAKYLGGNQGREIQDSFKKIIKKYSLQVNETNIALDGGNFVDNGVDSAIITDRIFIDNKNMKEDDIIKEIKEKTGLKHISIIPSEIGDKIAHSDGMVSFLDRDNLLITDYSNQPEFKNLVDKAIKRDISDKIKMDEVINCGTDKEHDGFSSAEGIYVNSLVTNNYIYMPTFGIKGDDEAFEKIKSKTAKEVIKIDVSKVCFLGGSLRCMSWQLVGENSKKLIEAARKRIIK